MGILIFEMMSGLPPFYNRDRTKMWSDMRHRPLSAPAMASFTPPAASLLKGLLQKLEEERLGSQPGAEGSEAIKAHPFFAGVDWPRLAQRDVTPPFIPSSTGRGAFQASFISDSGTGTDGDFAELGGFG